MPAYYELRGVPGVRKRIGLRELFVRRNSFFQEDRRWVPRASFAMENPLHSESNRWTDADLVPIISPRNLNLANDAMAQGVPLIVDLSEDCVPSKLLTCIPYASITLLVLPSLTAEMIPAVQSAMSCHLPIGVHVTESGEIPEQAQFVVVSEDLLVRGWQTSRRLPVVVTREWSIEGRSPAELRAACDQFQAELEHGADYAGLWLYPKTVP
ncbi:hypothetical protein C5Y93_18955 [Blastopirellula marina]|uniref:Uncharacterized protein n=1 Tax=Blastopirellula marina TaxID=124 RepID=A0A2S8GJJ5_9BACT|nr:hypothetical protein C5Y93_18955 [Blastopirellula marina]